MSWSLTCLSQWFVLIGHFLWTRPQYVFIKGLSTCVPGPQSSTLVVVSARCPAEEERRSRPRRPGPPRPASSSPWGACCATSREACPSIASVWGRPSTWPPCSSISPVSLISGRQEKGEILKVHMMLLNHGLLSC